MRILKIMQNCIILECMNKQNGQSTTLTVTERGQVTLRKDVLKHVGVKPGEKVELVLLPGGRAELRATQPTGTINDFIGLLAGKSDKVATLEEIKSAAEDGWAGKK